MRRSVIVLLLAGLVCLCSWSAIADEPAAEKEKQTLRVAAVQMRSTRSLEDNLSKTSELLARCAKDGARVVVFPECSVTGYFDKDYMQGITAEALAHAEQQIAAACRQHDVYAVVGMPCRVEDKLYNSAVIFDPAGRVIERYHKVKLAESWPDPGDHLAVFKVDGVPCSVIVCHDERYPELVRLPVLAGARLIFYVSHESPLHEERKLDPYRAQVQARAVENTVFLVQANAPANPDATGSHGQSRIIAPDGNLLHEASIFNEDVVIETLDLSQATARMALRSLEPGPLADWWRQGVAQVRIID